MEQRKKIALCDIAIFLVILAVMFIIYIICFKTYKITFHDVDENMMCFTHQIIGITMYQAPIFAYMGWLMLLTMRFNKFGIILSGVSALLPVAQYLLFEESFSYLEKFLIYSVIIGYSIFSSGISAVLIYNKTKNKIKSFFITAGMVSAIYFFFMLLTNKLFVLQSESAEILGILLSCLAIFVPYLFEKIIRLITEREKIN